MQRHPFDNFPRRDPDTVLQAADILGSLTTEEFELLFSHFCHTLNNIDEETTEHAQSGTLVIIGIDLNEDQTDIAALSSPQTITGNSVQPRPYKPSGLENYDVIGMVQYHDALDTPERIHGALVEQLSTQSHLLTMIDEMTTQFNSMSSMHSQPPFEQNQPFTRQHDTMDNGLDNALDDLFDELSRSLDAIDFPKQPDNLRKNLEQYTSEETDHLELTQEGIQCKHCGAMYDNTTLDEAILCCPSSDDDTDTIPIDKKDRDFE